MILLQLSSGQGPIECCRAVALAVDAIQKQCDKADIESNVVEFIEAREPGCFKSALLQLNDNNGNSAKRLAQQWEGVMLWVNQSQYRPGHKRKNWYFSAQVYEIDESQIDSEIVFQTCRASGAGGQHVNTTDSAVRATHVKTGLCVRIESERSQHANKRLARALLFKKLEEEKQMQMTQQEKARWKQHWELQRGNPVKTFKGDKFVPIG